MPGFSAAALSRAASVDARPLRVAGAAVLGVAALRPVVGDPGMPCPFRAISGLPCPFCGMTRGVTSAVHGDVVGAVLFNPGSVLLVIAAIALLVMWRWRRVTFPVWLPYAMFAALWSFELAKFATGRPL